MNLHAIVRGAITTVNPDISALFLASTGNTVDVAGNQTPGYATAVTVRIQSQPLTTKDIRHTDFLSLQGVFRSVHMFGFEQGVVRANQKGGDLLKFEQIPGSGVQTWLVQEVIEQWPDWARLIVVLQQV